MQPLLLRREAPQKLKYTHKTVMQNTDVKARITEIATELRRERR